MQYSVRELRDSLNDKVAGLGISEEFRGSVAFHSVLVEIDVLIAQMNMFSVASSVMVTEEKKKISFEWDSPYQEHYQFYIKVKNKNELSCAVVVERKPELGKDGLFTKEKRVIEKKAERNENNEVVLTTSGAIVRNIDNNTKSLNRSFAERKIYDEYGVMKDREFRTYPEMPLNDHIDKLKIDSILYIPRLVFVGGFMSDEYETRTVMVRHMLDTARVLVDNRKEEKKFIGEIPLNREHGLKNMELDKEFNYPKEVLIKPMSNEELEELIRKERNSVVGEGLRRYAKGRTEYYYSSVEDNSFISDFDGTKKLN
ncbi:MAG TPA: hypothetical protein DCE23_07205 [Firmicutes bacterium]|nr:hypothetical protein [Bacillota bacterium]